MKTNQIHQPDLSPRRSVSGAKRAFTLIELLVVVVIIGVIASLGLPALKGIRKSQDMKVATRQLMDDFGFARQKAISERTTVYVVFVPPTIVNPTLFAQLRPDRKAMQIYTNLARGQYFSYALYSDRSVGDQPGRLNARYLTEWKTLPEGIFIATNKFQNWFNNRIQYITTVASANRPFLPPRLFRFPHQQSLTDWPLPYVAFNWQGQLVYPEGWEPQFDKDETIPLARGSIFFPQAQDGRFLAADIQETPRGNSTNTFNRVRINWLTGRARVERPEIQ
ncbi:MAG TPA: prepilin-type N-terminal cleavage/methylation domain-containing protein [Candidatus Paceibacterota bacterium]|nr:prepilin-type N-terminal cleavage/methylation domain-containing protein [Verrucomicrobiota bacterium]HRY48185.1 prepilin-type N-terminal cleavage/methylation domain-containing protein [Candidatus Paceibacterota bacterium]